MLTYNERRLTAFAVAAHLEDAGISVAAEDLPDAERLRERGWLERRMDDEPVYSLTPAGETAMAHNDLMAVDASEAS